jgi:hypothetical protein
LLPVIVVLVVGSDTPDRKRGGSMDYTWNIPRQVQIANPALNADRQVVLRAARRAIPERRQQALAVEQGIGCPYID